MERVLGVGGYFMRASDPVALGAWYRDCLGLDADENGLWRQEAGVTGSSCGSPADSVLTQGSDVLVAFPRLRDMTIQRMDNVAIVVDDAIARLRAHGAELLGDVAPYENIFRLCYLRGATGIIAALAEQIG